MATIQHTLGMCCSRGCLCDALVRVEGDMACGHCDHADFEHIQEGFILTSTGEYFPNESAYAQREQIIAERREMLSDAENAASAQFVDVDNDGVSYVERQRGRPLEEVDGEMVVMLREANYSWAFISRELDIRPRTLYNWRQRSGFQDQKPHYEVDAVDEAVFRYLELRPLDRGEVTMLAHLQSTAGFSHITRHLVRESIHRVDPESCRGRKAARLKRADYHVDGPHALWHIDGWHKLIRYGLVIMGCIDGCTRTLIYLWIVDNNRAKTSLGLFKDGVDRYTLPARVRSDKGGENVLICDYMLERRRDDWLTPFIARSSRHNTRIERLWRDMRRNTLNLYLRLFRYMESIGMDNEDDLHMWVLHFMFVPLIQQDLFDFIDMWNNHKISTEHNKSPRQLEYELRQTYAPPIPHGIDDFYGDEVDEYSNDDVELLPDQPYVELDPLKCPLTEEQLARFESRVEHLLKGEEMGTYVSRYQEALNIATEIYSDVDVD